MKYKKHLLLLVPLLCLLFGLWYARPVDLYTLEPGLQAPQQITVRLTRYQDRDMKEEIRTAELQAGDPAFEELLTQVETLRFRRSSIDFFTI